MLRSSRTLPGHGELARAAASASARAISRGRVRARPRARCQEVLAPGAGRPRAARAAAAPGTGSRSAGRTGPRGSAPAGSPPSRSLLVAAITRTSTSIAPAAAHALDLAAPAARAAPWPASSGSCRRSRRGTGCRRRPARTCPCASASGAGEGALLVAEQLALDQLLGDRRAVDLDERPRAARGAAAWMARATSSLPGAVLAVISTRARCSEPPAAISARSAPHRGALADHRVALVEPLAQRAHLGLEPPAGQRVALTASSGLLERERLLDEVLRAEPHGLRPRSRSCRAPRSPPPAARRRRSRIRAQHLEPVHAPAATRRAARGRSGAPRARRAPPRRSRPPRPGSPRPRGCR